VLTTLQKTAHHHSTVS